MQTNLNQLIEIIAHTTYAQVDSVLRRKEFSNIYEFDKNTSISICASVSLFDINDHNERKISRRKISLYMDIIRSNILICHAASDLMSMFYHHFSSMMAHLIDVKCL